MDLLLDLYLNLLLDMKHSHRVKSVVRRVVIRTLKHKRTLATIML